MRTRACSCTRGAGGTLQRLAPHLNPTRGTDPRSAAYPANSVVSKCAIAGHTKGMLPAPRGNTPYRARGRFVQISPPNICGIGLGAGEPQTWKGRGRRRVYRTQRRRRDRKPGVSPAEIPQTSRRLWSHGQHPQLGRRPTGHFLTQHSAHAKAEITACGHRNPPFWGGGEGWNTSIMERNARPRRPQANKRVEWVLSKENQRVEKQRPEPMCTA